MIDVKRIKVDGFKNVVDLDLELSNITALLAANSYGKSNVLLAIDFGIDYISQSPKVKKNMLSYGDGMPKNKNNVLSNFVFEISMNISQGDESCDAKYGYSFEWRNKDHNGRIIEEHFEIKKNGLSQKYTTLFKRGFNSGFFLTSQVSAAKKKISVEDHELLVNKLLAFDNLFYHGLLNEINALDYYLDRSFEFNAPYELSPLVPKGGSDKLSFNDGSLPHTLYLLKKKHPGKYNLIVNTMVDLFPFIENMTLKEIKLGNKQIQAEGLPEDAPFELANVVYFLMVKTTYFAAPVRFTMMSDGVKRILLMLTKMCLAELSNIPVIGIEEPENSIHPGLLRKYIQTISAFLEHTKVIISSHSPFIVNNIPLSDVYLGIPDEDYLARFHRLSVSGGKRINKYASEIGTESGLLLFSILTGSDDFDLEMLRKSVVN